MRAAFLLGIWMMVVAACSGPDATEQQANRLYTLADLPAHVSVLVENVLHRGGAIVEDLDRTQGARLRAGLETASLPELADAAARRVFAEDWQPDAARAALRWYSSDTGTRMRALEDAANESDADAALSSFVDEIVREPVPLRRIELLERLAAAVRAAQGAAELEAGAARIVLRGMQAVQPEGEALDDAELLAAVDAVYASRLSRSRMQSSVILQFVYRGASDDEIEEYVRFAESAAGEWLVERSRAALAAAVDSLEARLLEQLRANAADAGG